VRALGDCRTPAARSASADELEIAGNLPISRRRHREPAAGPIFSVIPRFLMPPGARDRQIFVRCCRVELRRHCETATRRRTSCHISFSRRRAQPPIVGSRFDGCVCSQVIWTKIDGRLKVCRGHGSVVLALAISPPPREPNE
jgi:hypothetical protein